MPLPAKPYLHRGWWVTNLGGSRRKLCREEEGKEAAQDAFDELRRERRHIGGRSGRSSSPPSSLATRRPNGSLQAQPLLPGPDRWPAAPPTNPTERIHHPVAAAPEPQQSIRTVARRRQLNLENSRTGCSPPSPEFTPHPETRTWPAIINVDLGRSPSAPVVAPDRSRCPMAPSWRSKPALFCRSVSANGLKLLEHTLAYALVVLHREAIAGVAEVAKAEVSALRQKLWKVGAVVKSSVRRIWFHFSGSWPYRRLFVQVYQGVGSFVGQLSGEEAGVLPGTSILPLQ